jgi:hypothetical protein
MYIFRLSRELLPHAYSLLKQGLSNDKEEYKIPEKLFEIQV